MKRAAPGAPDNDESVLHVKPLGAGNEVGRSCLLMKYKGLTVMLDCGVLPSFSGEASLPLLREVDPASVDVVVITHFHLDHCAALPYFTERMAGFRGRIFATHATIAVMRLILQDFTKRSGVADAAASAGGGGGGGVEDREGGEGLYDEADMVACLARIEPVVIHQRVDIGRGAIMTLFNAGHVLGAAMVLLEVGRVKILYTGDFSCEEDRHLQAAEVPKGLRPDVLIAESTCGLSVHEGREVREGRFTDAVEKIVRKGGKCLIPMQALGRAQELLLILEDLWARKPELQGVPIYFSSRMADKALEVYRTFIGAMNASVGRAMGEGKNPWRLRFTRSVSGRELAALEGGGGGAGGGGGGGPCVVIAAPGMLQQGTSRELFERWAENPINGVVLAGYATEGTLARRLEQNPTAFESLKGSRVINRRCGIERISFIAHSDCLQTQAFVEALKPSAIVLVHGEKKGMAELCGVLGRRYAGAAGWRGCWMPGLNTDVEFAFVDAREARVVGKLAQLAVGAAAGGSGSSIAVPHLAGVLVQRNFDTLFLAPTDLAKFTAVSMQTLGQKVHVPYRCSFGLLKDFLVAMYGVEGVVEGVEGVEDAPPGPPGKPPRKTLTVTSSVTLTHAPPDRVLLKWSATPQSDMVADSLVALIAQVGLSRVTLSATSRPCAHSSSSAGGGGGHPHTHTAECQHGHTSSGSGTASGGSEVGETATSFSAANPWAHHLLSCDSGPLGGGMEGAVSRRCAVLGDLLRSQYEEEGGGSGSGSNSSSSSGSGSGSNVVVEGEEMGTTGSSSSSHTFSIRVALAGVGVARVKFTLKEGEGQEGGGEFTVSLVQSGGGGSATAVSSFLDSLARTCDMADSLCRNAVLGPHATVAISTDVARLF